MLGRGWGNQSYMKGMTFENMLFCCCVDYTLNINICKIVYLMIVHPKKSYLLILCMKKPEALI